MEFTALFLAVTLVLLAGWLGSRTLALVLFGATFIACVATYLHHATDVLKLVDAERIYADVRREALSLAIDAYVAAIEARFALAQEDIP